ncbi:MAG: hypothetical protein JSW71_23510 [Gemmatimonadota bacterium]|nr:MAG: hypothetical protein JSW71_23510 [Gemmatimonadota bacterium]
MIQSGPEPDPEQITKTQPGKGEDGDRVPDPWGVKRAENLLQSLQAVLSARVVVSPVGEIQEVHVLASSGVSPKQVVRNVESALLAHLGIKVDHRKISVAQTAEVEPIEALEQSAVKQEAQRRGVVYQSLELVAAAPHRVRFAVTLDVDGQEVVGQDEAAETSRARLQAAARAAVAALDKALPRGTFQLEGVKIIEAFDEELVVAGVHVVDGRETRLLTGTAEVREAPEQAAVLAVLDATNRWFQTHR